MVKKYKVIKVPVETYNIIKIKKVKMENRIKKITGQSRGIPITRIVKVMADRPLYLFDDDVYKLGRKKKKCGAY